MKLLAFLALPFFLSAAEDASAVIVSAQAAPAEFSADALSRLGPTRPQNARSLIEQAFERAAAAQVPLKLRSAVARPDSPGTYWNRVFGQELDGLSLRLRAVDAMLPFDATKAHEMFERIPPRKLAPVPCTDFLVPDLSHYYETLGSLAKGASDSGKLLERYALGFTSPVEAGPAAMVIAQSKVSD